MLSVEGQVLRLRVGGGLQGWSWERAGRLARRLKNTRALCTMWGARRTQTREREREDAPLALRAARPHTVGYTGVMWSRTGGDQMPFSAATRRRVGGGQLLIRNVERVQRGLVFEAHKFLYNSTLDSRAVKKKKKGTDPKSGHHL